MKVTEIYYHEAVCPICNRTIKGFYCPFCGLPIKIGDKYYWRTRSEFSINSIYPICKKCYTPNPQNAQYCRNCGGKMHECKYNTKEWSLKSRNLDEVVTAVGYDEDLIQDGGIYKIIDKSYEGFYDERFGKNAVVVIMERCIKKGNGKIEGTGDTFINLSAFDRSAVPYKKEADGFLVRDGECVRADGTVVVTWKASKNAKAFMKDNVGKYFTTKLKKKVPVRAWDCAAERYSKTELKDKNVYTIDWV